MMKRIMALLLGACFLLGAAGAESERPVLEIHQMTLGYADGYFLRCGDVEILIDAGNPEPTIPNDDPTRILRQLGATKLDAYIVTHWHLDHCANVNVLLAEFGDENTVLYSPSVSVHPDYDPLANGTYRQMKMGDVVEIGGMVFSCTGPETYTQYGNQNKDSLNFLLTYGERRIFFTGDYCHSLLVNGAYLDLLKDVDVLKFPHHGSTPFFIGPIALRNLSPEYILMPSSMNNWPIYEFCVENSLKLARDNILSNRAGHVVVLTDGEFLEVRTTDNPADFAPKAE